MEIPVDDVIKLIQQFLKEQNLTETLKALQLESGVVLNVMPRDLKLNIIQGKWKEVVKDLMELDLHPKHFCSLYEQMVLEFIEEGEVDGARMILRESEPMEYLRDQNPDRYLALEGMLNRSDFDIVVAYGNLNKDQKRREIANALCNSLETVEDKRLLALLGQALKWNVQQKLISSDSEFNLFTGKVPKLILDDNAPVDTLHKSITFPKRQHPEACAFSPNGKYFCLGTFDGFIEVWDYLTGKLRKDLVYQDKDDIMLLDSCCLCLRFSECSKFLAAGEKVGNVVVWDINNGKSLQKFKKVHDQGVTVVVFSKDSSQILTGSFDQTLKIIGRNSGKVLKVFRGHSSFVNAAEFTADYSKIISGSSDGTVKFWNVSTTECLRTVNLLNGESLSRASNLPSINTILKWPGKDEYLVCSNSRFAYVLNGEGELVKVYHYQQPGGIYICGSISATGQFLYFGTENGKLECFSTETGSLLKDRKVCDSEFIGMKHHPLLSILVVFSVDGKVGIWKTKDIR